MWCVPCAKARQKCLHFSAGNTTLITKAEKKRNVVEVGESKEEEKESREEEDLSHCQRPLQACIAPQKHWEVQDYAAIPLIGQG